LRPSGIVHTKTSQSTVAVQKGINKLELEITNSSKKRTSPFVFYICDKSGAKPAGVTLPTSSAQQKTWATEYQKALELNWENFALKTFQTHCANCHAVETTTVGPALKGLFGKTQTVIFADGSKKEMTIDTDYLRNSITDPLSSYPEGTVPAMPKLPLSDREVETLVRWIKGL